VGKGMFVRLGLLALAVPLYVWGQVSITLEQKTYRLAGTPPFNGQVAFFVDDIQSGYGKSAIKLPFDLHILVTYGRRPFAVDTGPMDTASFLSHVTLLRKSARIEYAKFPVAAEQSTVSFSYLFKKYTVKAKALVPCAGCPGRIVLEIQPGEAGAK
jgi:hypothetical protein